MHSLACEYIQMNLHKQQISESVTANYVKSRTEYYSS